MPRLSRLGLLIAALGINAATSASAVACRDESYAGNRYTLCEVDAATEELRLFLAMTRDR